MAETKKRRIPGLSGAGNFFKENKFLSLYFAAFAAYYGYDYYANDFGHDPEPVHYSEMVDLVTGDETERDPSISRVEIVGTNVIAYNSEDGKIYTTQAPANENVYDRLQSSDVDISVDEETSYVGLYIVLAVMALGIAAHVGLNRFKNKKKTDAIKTERPKVTFDDVQGIDEVKDDIKKIVNFLKEPEKSTRLGAKMPKGALLAGPPGTGKTLLARAMAGEANVPMFHISGGSVVELYVGNGAKKIREIFEKAKKETPSIVFIDEIDAFGKARANTRGSGEEEKALLELLAQMDGFKGSEGVIVIGATNHPESLDPALLRAGRFDRQLVVQLPDEKGREKILEIHSRDIVLAKNIDMKPIAKRARGFSGADLENLCNQAADIATDRGADAVYEEDFMEAYYEILMGAERNLAMTEEQQRITARHEAGHAIVGYFKEKEGLHPVEMASITPRRNALGVTVFGSNGDQYGQNKRQLLANLSMSMGGRAAEILFNGSQQNFHDNGTDLSDVTNGAVGDIRQSTDMAWNMVAKMGFDEDLGPVNYGRDGIAHMAQSMRTSHGMNDHTAKKVKDKVVEMLKDAQDDALNILRREHKALIALEDALMEHETLERDEIIAIIKENQASPEIANDTSKTQVIAQDIA